MKTTDKKIRLYRSILTVCVIAMIAIVVALAFVLTGLDKPRGGALLPDNSVTGNVTDGTHGGADYVASAATTTANIYTGEYVTLPCGNSGTEIKSVTYNGTSAKLEKYREEGSGIGKAIRTFAAGTFSVSGNMVSGGQGGADRTPFVVIINSSPRSSYDFGYSAASLEFGQTLGQAKITNNASKVSGTWTFNDTAVRPTAVGQATYTAKFTPSDLDYYTVNTANVTVTVNKATPTITLATLADNTAITYGQLVTQRAVKVSWTNPHYSGWTGNANVTPSCFVSGTATGTLQTTATRPNAGVTHKLGFTLPAPNSNYNANSLFTTAAQIWSNGPVLSVAKQTPTVAPATLSVNYGNALSTVTPSGTVTDIYNTAIAVSGTWSWASPTTVPSKSGTQTMNWTSGNPNYNSVSGKTATVNITPVAYSSITLTGYQYAGAQANPLTYGKQLSETGTVNISYKTANGAFTKTRSFTWSQLGVTDKKMVTAGANPITVTLPAAADEDNGYFNAASGNQLIVYVGGMPIDVTANAVVIEYGKTLDAVKDRLGGTATADNGNTTVNGTWSWDEAKNAVTTRPDAVTRTYYAKFTPAASNYGVRDNISVTVNVVNTAPIVDTARGGIIVYRADGAEGNNVMMYGENAASVFRATVHWVNPYYDGFYGTYETTLYKVQNNNDIAVLSVGRYVGEFRFQADKFTEIATGTAEIEVIAQTPNFAVEEVTVEYGGTVSSGGLPVGTVTDKYQPTKEIAGVWSWTTGAGTTRPTYNTATGEVEPGTYYATFTPTDGVNYAALVGVPVTLRMTASTPVLTVTEAKLYYGQKIGDLGAIEITAKNKHADWTVKFTKTAAELLSNQLDVQPAVGEYDYSFTVAGTDFGENTLYSETQAVLHLTVERAVPKVVANPTAAQIEYGQPLSSSILTGAAKPVNPATGAEIDGLYSWKAGETVAEISATKTYKAVFTPNDLSNYTTAEIEMAANVVKSDPAVKSVNELTKTYNPNPSEYFAVNDDGGAKPGRVEELTGVVENKYAPTLNVNGYFKFTAEAKEKIAKGLTVNGSPYSLGVEFVADKTADGTALYNNAFSTVKVTVTPKSVEVTDAVLPDIVYGQTLSQSDLANTTYTATDGVQGTFACNNPDLRLAVGGHDVSVTFTPAAANNGNYEQARAVTAHITVQKAGLVLSGTVAVEAGILEWGNPMSSSVLTWTAGNVTNATTGEVVAVYNDVQPRGKFTWINPEFIPAKGLTEGEVVFHVTDATAANYNSVKFGQTVKLTVGVAVVFEAAGDVLADPANTDKTDDLKGSAIRYGQSLAGSAIGGGQGFALGKDGVTRTTKIDGTFAWSRPAVVDKDGTVLDPAKDNSTIAPQVIVDGNGDPTVQIFTGWFTPYPDSVTGTDYNPIEIQVPVLVERADFTVTNASASTVGFGDPIGRSTVSFDPTAVPLARHAWAVDPATPVKAGDAYDYIFYPQDSVNYNNCTVRLALTVTPKELAPVDVETLAGDRTLYYGEKLGSLTLTGGTVLMPDGVTAAAGKWEFVTPETEPAAGTSYHAVRFVFDDEIEQANYKVTTTGKGAPVTVARATADVVFDPITITYGDKLTNDVLSATGRTVTNPYNGEAIEQGLLVFESDVNQTVPYDANTEAYTFYAHYYPNTYESKNYTDVHAPVTVTVLPRALSIDGAKLGIITYGQKLADITVTSEEILGTDGLPLAGEWSVAALTDSMGNVIEYPTVGTYATKIRFVPDSTNYTEYIANAEFAVEQAKTALDTSKIGAITIEYGDRLTDSLIDYDLTGLNTATLNGVIAGETVGMTYGFAAIDGAPAADKVLNAGHPAVTVEQRPNNPNYAVTVGEISITVNPIAYDVSGMTFFGTTVDYDKNLHTLAVGGAIPDGVTAAYYIECGADESEKEFEGKHFKAFGGAVNAGVYEVWAFLTGDANHFELRPMTATLTVNKLNPIVGVKYHSTGLYSDKPMPEIKIDKDLPGYTRGEVAWDTAVLLAGTNEYTWTFTPDDTVNYNTAAGTETLTALALEGEGLLIFTEPTKKAYAAFETLDYTGASLRLAMNDSTMVNIDPLTDTNLIAVYKNGGDSFYAGETTVTLRYEYKGKTFEKTVVGITVDKIQSVAQAKVDNPNVMSYEGLPELVADSAVEQNTLGTFAWNKDQILTSGTKAYAWTFTPDDIVNYLPCGGEIELTVTAVGVESITAALIDPTYEYYTGYGLDALKAQLKVDAYKAGGEVIENIHNYTLTLPDQIAYGEANAVKVTYTADAVDGNAGAVIETSVNVVVNQSGLVELTVTKQPTPMEFYQGNTVDPTDFTVNKVYSDGRTEIVPFDANGAAGYTVVYQNGTAFTVNDTKVTFRYTETVDGVPATVTAELAVTVVLRDYEDVNLLKFESKTVDYEKGIYHTLQVTSVGVIPDSLTVTYWLEADDATYANAAQTDRMIDNGVKYVRAAAKGYENAGEYKLLAVFKGDANYNAVPSMSATLTVNKIDDTAVIPAVTPYTGVYDPTKTLDADYALTVLGFKWKDGAAVPTVGTKEYTAIYNRDPINYFDREVTVRVDLTKADYNTVDITKPEFAGVYDPTKTLDVDYAFAAGSGFEWKDGAVVPTVTKGEYAAIYNADVENYNNIEVMIKVTLAKAVPVYEIPKPGNVALAEDGQPDKKLSGVTLPQGWAWDAPDTALTATGEVIAKATYTPIDTDNYLTATEDVTFKVVPAGGKTIERVEDTVLRITDGQGNVLDSHVYDENTTLYLSNVAGERTIASVIGKFNNNPDTVRVFDASGKEIDRANFGTTYLGSGMKIRLYDGAAIADEVTAVIKGDLNGDGKVNVFDQVKLIPLVADGTESELEMLAADLTGDKKLNIFDLSNLLKHLADEENLFDGMEED